MTPYMPCPKNSDAHFGRFGDLGKGCFRCAVDFVIARFGGDPNCECRRSGGGSFCVECEVRAFDWNGDGDSPLQAFQAAIPPYRGLARYYAGLAGSFPVQLEEGIITYGQNRDLIVPRLLEEAKTDPLAFDAAMWMAAECVRYNLKVPAKIREWAYLAMTGQIARPPQRGKYPPALVDRNRAIVGLVKDVVRIIQIRATSADEDCGQGACHAVAEGLRLLRLQPNSYAAIKKIWRNRSDRAEIPAFLRIPQ